jgi:hypothetical protein
MPRAKATTKKAATKKTAAAKSPANGEKAVAAPVKKKAASKKKSMKEVVIPRIDIKLLQLTVVGDTDLICHAWSQKVIKEMLDKQMGKANKKRDHKDPEADFKASLYELPDGRFGFPGIAFKLAAVEACRFVDGLAMTEAYGAFHVNDEFIIIESPKGPYMRQDMVRVGGKGPGTGVADIRFRGAFKNWKATITVRYNASVITPEQIANLFNIAGFSIGVGEWRPPKRGVHGTFHVEVQ